MSCKKGGKTKKHLLLAKLATNYSGPCAFCNRNIDDETIYGKLYSIGDIQCHYFCVLLSCCLVQKGKDSEGLFGFLYPDIIAEIERSKKHKCSYCGREGASLGCSVSQCRKQFHLPCGREKDAISLFYGNYKSFCRSHAPRQKINLEIMTKVRERTLAQRQKTKVMTKDTTVVGQETELRERNINLGDESTKVTEIVCVICYELVEASPSIKTFWPPCCARDAWFHRSCLQRMALSAGMHYLKCPLCNDKEVFLDAVMTQGYYVPDRDAAWELEQNAFSEIYERSVSCSAADCSCPMGREHDSDTDAGPWDIKLCILCGSSGMHDKCMQAGNDSNNSCQDGRSGRRYICVICAPAAPEDIDSLVATIETVLIGEGEDAHPQPRRRAVVMPCRMSLRRTKQRIPRDRASSSNTTNLDHIETNGKKEDETLKEINAARMDLNLKSPKKPPPIIKPNIINNVDNKLISPLKLLEKGLYERINETEATDFQLDFNKLIEVMSEKFKKPKPLIAKKKIISELLENVLEDMKKDKIKAKESVREWNSPKKCVDVAEEDILVREEELFEEGFRGFETVIENPPIDVKEIELVKADGDNVVEEEIADDREMEAKKTEDGSESVAIFSTLKKLKPIHVQKDSSMEISENNQTVNIDVVQIEENEPNGVDIEKIDEKCSQNANLCAFKFSSTDKEELRINRLDIDIESFKNHYLNEVDRDGKCTGNCNSVSNDEVKLKTGVKRKMPVKESVAKRRKKSRKHRVDSKKESEIQLECSKIRKPVNTKMKNKNKTRKHKAKLSIENKNIKVKIRWRSKQLKLQITESSRRKKKQTVQKKKKLKQYVLNFSPEKSCHNLERPQQEVVPKKRKYIKTEKTTDKLVQTSLYDFFKANIDKKIT